MIRCFNSDLKKLKDEVRLLDEVCLCSSTELWPLTFAGCGRWGIQRYFAWIKNPKPMKEKKKEKLVSPNGHAPAVIGRQDEIFLPVDQS